MIDNGDNSQFKSEEELKKHYESLTKVNPDVADQPRDEKGRWVSDEADYKDPNHKNPYLQHDYHANDAAGPFSMPDPEKGPIQSLKYKDDKEFNPGNAPELKAKPVKPAPPADARIAPIKVGIKWSKS